MSEKKQASNKLKQFIFHIDPKLSKRLDQYVEAHEGTNRSLVVRWALQRYLSPNPKDLDKLLDTINGRLNSVQYHTVIAHTIIWELMKEFVYKNVDSDKHDKHIDKVVNDIISVLEKNALGIVDEINKKRN